MTGLLIALAFVATLATTSAESIEQTYERNIAYLRSTAGCSVPLDLDRTLIQHLKFSFNQRGILVSHIEVNFDYYTINKRYHVIVMPDSRGVTAFARRRQFERNSLIPRRYSYDHVATSISRPITEVCRKSYNRDLAVVQAIFTSLQEAATSGQLPYESIIRATVCFPRRLNPDLRTLPRDVLELANSEFICCKPGEYLENCLKMNHTIDDAVQVGGHFFFLGAIYAMVYLYLLPLVIAWVLFDVNCLEDGRTLSYLINPKTAYFGYAQLGFPPFIKKVIFVLLGISGYALIAIVALTNRGPVNQLWFIVCFLILSVILMFSAKRLVQSDALRPPDRYILGFIQLWDDSHQKAVLGPTSKADIFLQQHEMLNCEHPDISIYPSLSDGCRLLFMSKYWSKYVKLLRRLCGKYKLFVITLPISLPILLILFVINTIPLFQLVAVVILQSWALLTAYSNGPSTMILFGGAAILLIGYIGLLLYIPCVLVLCLYYTAVDMLYSVHLLMVGLAIAIVVYQLGMFICHEAAKLTMMTECVIGLNLVYLRYEGATHRAPCCEQLVRSVPLNPEYVQINSIFFDSLVKSFLPLSHSLKMVMFRAGLFLFICIFLFVTLVQCGANFFVNQAISINLLLAVVVPKLVFSLWPCCSYSSTVPPPSIEQAIYILIDDWYRKNCSNSSKPSPTILKLGPAVDSVGKLTPQLASRDIVISNIMEQMPYSDNFYGTINTGKSGSSPIANYADTTLAESGRYTLSSSRHGCNHGTLSSGHNVSQHPSSQLPPNGSNSMIKHAVFASKHHPTASSGDTGSEVDSILYYNDIITKHPADRISASQHRKATMDMSLNESPINMSADNSSTEDSHLGPSSPGSYGDSSNNVRIVIPQSGGVKMRSQSETDESNF